MATQNLATTAERQPLTGGMTPLLKQRLMVWFLEHKQAGGDIARLVDSAHLSEVTGATVTNVNRALWSLQKQGLITFREQKNGGSGHSSGTFLSRFHLTPKGLAWDADTAVLADLAHKDDVQDGDLDPTFVRGVETDEVADEMRRVRNHHVVDKIADMVGARGVPPAPCTCGHDEGTVLRSVEHLRGCPWAKQQQALFDAMTNEAHAIAAGDSPENVAARIIAIEEATRPPFVLSPGTEPGQALFAYLKHEGGRAKIVPTTNLALGYHAKSTALYSIVRGNPEGFAIEKGWVILKDDRPAGWQPKGQKGHTNMRTPARVSSPVSDEKRTDLPLLNGDDPTSDAGFRELVAIDLVGAYPHISAVMEREQKRAKVAEAVAALEAAGLEDDALTVLGRIPDDTPLEQEVVRLVKALRDG
jgi:hypothetical protein